MSKRVWEVCEPHPDVFARDMDPSVFAASLHAVEAGTADPDYTDPERFFAKTFMTQSLENVMEGVLGRLLGRSGRGAPVLRLETPFGGGKTHTMVALYHLARNPEAVEETETGRRLCEKLNVAHLPRQVRLAVLDGVALDLYGRGVDGLTIRTLWGELAYRLGGKLLYEAVRSADEARTAPGQAVLTELLKQAQPALILMDEVHHYVAKARAVKVGESTLASQTMAFMRELTGAVGDAPRAVLIFSLPASSLEVPDEDQAWIEEILQRLRKMGGRTELIETPVAQDEVFGVLRRRLFRSVGSEREAKQAVEAYMRYYEEYARFFPEGLRRPAYRERMQKAYPFHPELVDLLYQRWGPHPQFQRTRGALRLMALVLRRLWGQRPGSAILIQPHHIDLVDRHIRAEVVRLLDGAFDAIVTGDVVGRSREIDRDLGGEYQHEQLAEGAAKCALLYSISAGSERAGCTEEELRVALLRPRINPAQVTEVLGRLLSRLWYLRYRDRRYFFDAKPNLNKVILDFEQGISDEKVEESLYEHLARVAGQGKGELQVYIARGDVGAVSEPSRATLVLVPLGLGDMDEAQEWMKGVVARITNRNLLIFLAPARAQEGELRVAVRRWLALQGLRQAQMFRELDRDDRDEVERQFKEKEGEIQGLLFSIYSRVFRVAPGGVEEERLQLKRDGKTLAEAVAAALRERGVMVESLSPEYLSQVLKVDETPVSMAQVETVLTGTPGQPIVVDPERAIRSAIREGVKKGSFGVRLGDQTFTDEVPEEVLRSPHAVLIPPAATSPLKTPIATGKLTLKAKFSGNNLYPLRNLLEEIQGKDVGVTVEVVDTKGVLRGKRHELDALLRDYGIEPQWHEGDD